MLAPNSQRSTCSPAKQTSSNENRFIGALVCNHTNVIQPPIQYQKTSVTPVSVTEHPGPPFQFVNQNTREQPNVSNRSIRPQSNDVFNCHQLASGRSPHILKDPVAHFQSPTSLAQRSTPTLQPQSMTHTVQSRSMPAFIEQASHPKRYIPGQYTSPSELHWERYMRTENMSCK